MLNFQDNLYNLNINYIKVLGDTMKRYFKLQYLYLLALPLIGKVAVKVLESSDWWLIK